MHERINESPSHNYYVAIGKHFTPDVGIGARTDVICVRFVVMKQMILSYLLSKPDVLGSDVKVNVLSNVKISFVF
jgi:hypothetical protein